MSMRVVDIPRGLRRAGKLRAGETVESSNGKPRPAKLETWKITSPDERVAADAAAAFGGTVEPFTAEGSDDHFGVVTKASVLDVLVLPDEDAFSQSWEMWTAGGCVRRCNGQVEQLSGNSCMCPADHEERSRQAKLLKPTACKLTTRLAVVVPRLAALGAFTVESHGFYAAKELASTIDLLDMAGARRNLLRARLRLEQRTSRRDGETKRYVVPVLDIAVSFDELLELGRGEAHPLALVGPAPAVAPPPGVDPVTGEISARAQDALPPADPPPPTAPVTSTKKAGARKAAAAKKQSVIRQGAAIKDNDPMSPQEIAAVRARYDVLDKEHRALCQQLMNNARITLKDGPPKKSEAASIETILASVEAKQAEAWEDRRKRVFAAVEPYGFDDDARHQFISDATNGATTSTKTLTEEQASAIIEAAGGDAEQQTLEDAS